MHLLEIRGNARRHRFSGRTSELQSHAASPVEPQRRQGQPVTQPWAPPRFTLKWMLDFCLGKGGGDCAS